MQISTELTTTLTSIYYLPLTLLLTSLTPLIVSFLVAKLRKTDAWSLYVRASYFSFMRDLRQHVASEAINFLMWR